MQQDKTGIDWEDAFDNAGYVPGADTLLERLSTAAGTFRESVANAEYDLLYGDKPREMLDIFYPSCTPKGLAVFVHGGYWRRFDKGHWSHYAAGALARGWAVAMPSYTLAPAAELPEITREIAAAVGFAAGRVAGPIHLAGHSAGGHLVARLACADVPLPAEIVERIERVMPISGVFDLRPLQLHSMNADLALTPDTAASESPALLSPRPATRLHIICGGAERPEFLRQSALLHEAWAGDVAQCSLTFENNMHHFSVIEGFRDPSSSLCEAFLG